MTFRFSSSRRLAEDQLTHCGQMPSTSRRVTRLWHSSSEPWKGQHLVAHLQCPHRRKSVELYSHMYGKKAGRRLEVRMVRGGRLDCGVWVFVGL